MEELPVGQAGSPQVGHSQACAFRRMVGGSQSQATKGDYATPARKRWVFFFSGFRKFVQTSTFEDMLYMLLRVLQVLPEEAQGEEAADARRRLAQGVLSMTLTPTATSQAVAGCGLWFVLWMTLFKVNTLAKWLHLTQWVQLDHILQWIYQHKVETLLITGYQLRRAWYRRPSSTTFALGGTITNVLMIFGVMNVLGRVRRYQ